IGNVSRSEDRPMLYHFAITPDVFDPAALKVSSPESVILVELLRGIADNGLLADLHAGAWHTQIRGKSGIGSCLPAVRDKLLSCLTVIHGRNRLVKHPAGSVQPADDFCWLRWALERHQADVTYPMKGVVVSDAYIGLSEIVDPVLVPLPGVLDHQCW